MKTPFPSLNSARRFVLMAAALASLSTAPAAIAPAEKLLPEDTLAMLTVPDFARWRSLYAAAPGVRFWNDAAMKPFRDKFMGKLQSEVLEPLEKDLNIRFNDYTNLIQGQLTLAVTANGWNGTNDARPGWLVLLDTGARSGQLKTNLADLRKKWTDAGRTLRTEKVRDVEFTVITLSTNDVPKTFRSWFGGGPPTEELGDEPKPAKKAAPTELFLAQVQSVLLLGDSPKVLEKVVGCLGGASVPPLSDVPHFQTTQAALFRQAYAFGWINAKALVDVLARTPVGKPNPEAPNPFAAIQPDKAIAAVGLSGLRTAAFALDDSPEGTLVQLHLGVPQAERQGLFSIIAGSAKESAPPAFVPADVSKFSRWRLDGAKLWSTLEKTLGDISPQLLSGINVAIETASEAAKQQDPTFDFKKNFVANLGDDLISFEKTPKGKTVAELTASRSLFLVGSPNAEKLAASLKLVAALMGPMAEGLKEREFLGRKIYALEFPSAPAPGETDAGNKTISFVANGGYLGIGADTAMLEEWLRSAEGQGKALREKAGLTEAAQKVGGLGTGLFGFEDQAQTTRVAFDLMKKLGSEEGGLEALNPALAMAGADEKFKEWVDFTLLPEFTAVAKYFHYSVYAGNADANGLTLKFFGPLPPELKK